MSRDWTNPERLAAMYLYCQTPFGRLHARNPEIIALAEQLERTPSSLAMKLTNFASLDPEQQRRGIKGLRGASGGDRAMWRDFHADWTKMVESSARAYESFMLTTEDESRPSTPERHPPRPWTGGATTIERTVAARRGQDWFRATLIAGFDGTCCVSGCNVENMLVASHIVPWAEDSALRLNPHNGLLLSAIHDRAFESGDLAIDDDYRVLVAGSLRKSANEFLQQALVRFHGQPLRLPQRFAPDPNLLRQHREARFAG